jgi:hypothetical protein
MPPRRLSIIGFPLLAAGLQLVAWLAIVGLYTRVYTRHDSRLMDLELPLTYGLLFISGAGGGSLALIGMYRLLAYARRGFGCAVLLVLCGLSLLWAEICAYALLMFLPAI